MTATAVGEVAREARTRAVPAAARRLADGLLVFTAISIPLSTTGMEAGIIGLGVLTLVALVARWDLWRPTPLDGPLALFYATLALSTLASLHPLQAGQWARQWWVSAYFVVYWWVRDRRHAARVARWLLVAGVVAAVYGVLQHFTGADWYRAALGRQRMVRPRVAGGEGYAVVGFFRNYLTFAHVMLFPLAWSVAFALAGEITGALAAVPIVLAIVFSTARGAWLGALAIAAALVWVAGARRARLPLAALAVVALGGFLLRADLRAQAAHMFALGGVNAPRVAIYQANLDIVHDHPLLGLGFGRYDRAAKPYYERHPDADRRSHAHNNYLHIAAEAGLLGLAAFVLLWAMALRYGWRAVATAPDLATWATAAGAWAGIVGFCVGGVTQYSFGDAEVALAMWVALALLMRCYDGAEPH